MSGKTIQTNSNLNSIAVEVTREDLTLEQMKLPVLEPNTSPSVVENTSLFSDALSKPEPKTVAINSREAAIQLFKLQSQEALDKLDALKNAGLISEDVAKVLGDKVTGFGAGILGRVTPQRLTATLDNIQNLQERGLSADEINSRTTIAFKRGGITALDVEIHQLQKRYPEQTSQTPSDNSTPVEANNLSDVQEVNELTPPTPLPSTPQLELHNPFTDMSYRDKLLPHMNQPSSSRLNGSLEQLLSFIAKGEGGYNSMNQGTSGDRIVGSTHDASSILGRDLTDMTIGEVMRLQSSGKLFAAGRYQIIPSTMREVMTYSGLSTNDKFSAENQDKLAVALIYEKRPYLGAYLKGEHNDITGAMLEAAMEWASLPNPHTGRSFYGNGNRSSHTVSEVKSALENARGDR